MGKPKTTGNKIGDKTGGDGKTKKKNTSLRLDARTLKALKLRAIEEDTSIQKIIERLVEDYVKTSNKGE